MNQRNVPPKKCQRSPSSHRLETLLRRIADEDCPEARHDESLLFYSLLRARLRVLIRQEMSRTRGFLTKDDIEDVLQEILVSVWRTDLARYDSQKGSLMGFLRTRVRWQIHNAIRANARRKDNALRSQMSAHFFSQSVEAEASLEARTEGIAVRRALKKVLDTKDPVAAYAIDAHDLQGVPLIEIARTLRVHPSQITRARRRGLTYLRYILNARETRSRPQRTKSGKKG